MRFVCADALELPFDDGAFDAAITQHVAMNIADRARLYAAIRRVLGRVGGSPSTTWSPATESR